MQVVFLGNYVFWAWNLEVKDSNFWIPEVVHENAIPQQEQTQVHCTAFQSIPKHSKALFLCHDGYWYCLLCIWSVWSVKCFKGYTWCKFLCEINYSITFKYYCYLYISWRHCAIVTNRGQHADADVCNESNKKKAVVLMSLKAFLIS